MSTTKTDAPTCLWLHYARPRPHWYTLPDAERTELQARWSALRSTAVAAGAENRGRFHIRGQHDFETIETWVFDGSAAAFAHWQALVDARYSEFFAFSNNIGLACAQSAA
ncbi:hypothetical protein [Sagittula stellata]|uniref:ABM domain-containing protein n=1 Tax=Sagittula stellata (strain ATCC 700073 / DSM 11524 / E-37) TaxID=388399 RepID=A3K4E2_SAGS3|nr:hypothetical protein [Sagittula stellata]EBA07841.1 hypothetical protein SSE37_01270 [Sagittula stellata E-37]